MKEITFYLIRWVAFGITPAILVGLITKQIETGFAWFFGYSTALWGSYASGRREK